jgi:nitroreductase
LSYFTPYTTVRFSGSISIVVCGIPEKDEVFSKDYWVMDCSAASENILLACHALGLGAVWTAVYVDRERIANVRNILHIPENIIPLNVIPIGVPKEKGKALDKFKEGNIHWEGW